MAAWILGVLGDSDAIETVTKSEPDSRYFISVSSVEVHQVIPRV